jgi:hypothetical protein
VHRLDAEQREELLVGIEPTKRIDDKGQPGLRQVGFLDQQPLALRFGLITLDQSRGGQFPGVGNASAGPRWALSPLIALQNDPPNGQDLVPGQQFVLVCLGKRLLDIAVGGAGNLDCDIGRHDAAFDGGDEPLLAMFEQITNRGDVIGGEINLSGDFGIGVRQRRARCDASQRSLIRFDRSPARVSVGALPIWLSDSLLLELEGAWEGAFALPP